MITYILKETEYEVDGLSHHLWRHGGQKIVKQWSANGKFAEDHAKKGME